MSPDFSIYGQIGDYYCEIIFGFTSVCIWDAIVKLNCMHLKRR